MKEAVRACFGAVVEFNALPPASDYWFDHNFSLEKNQIAAGEYEFSAGKKHTSILLSRAENIGNSPWVKRYSSPAQKISVQRRESGGTPLPRRKYRHVSLWVSLGCLFHDILVSFV